MTDTIRTSLEWVLQDLIAAEAMAFIGAGRHERTDTRLTQRNGTASGCCPRRPAMSRSASPSCGRVVRPQSAGAPSALDRALYAVVIEAWVHGVSTRKVDDLVKALGVASGISKSEVNCICVEMDRDLESSATAPSTTSPSLTSSPMPPT